jgi:F-type H+-transporting ATPase subunit c
LPDSRPGREKDSAGERFRSGATEDRKREGASTVSLNHPLAVNLQGSRRIMRKLQYVFMALAALCFAIPAFADGGSPAINMVPIGVGLGMGLAAGLCGLGQGRAVGSTTEALARNPGTRAGLMTFMIIGLAFIESLTLFTFAMIIIKVK